MPAFPHYVNIGTLKILIVKLSSIGDIVHALPALAHIRDRMPEAEIGWAVDSRYAELLRGNKLIDHLIQINTRSLRGGIIEERFLDTARQFGTLRKYRFDIALDMQGLLKSGAAAKFSGAPRRWGFARKHLREPASRVFLTDTVDFGPFTHVVRRNLILASDALGLEPKAHGFDFPIHTEYEHKAKAQAIVEKIGTDFVILNPAGGWITKLWHADKYGTLADILWEKLGLASVVAVGPKENALGEIVLKNSRSGRTILEQPSLKGFYELAKRAALYVGGDTGPTHIAIAAGTPTVGIFGPTEWWRNGSVDPDDICVERNDIDCRVDCHRRTCSKWVCMDITVETVFDAVERRMQLENAEG